MAGYLSKKVLCPQKEMKDNNQEMRTYDFDKQPRRSWKHVLDLAVEITFLFDSDTTSDRPTPISALLEYVAA